ncbi:MAG: hypothetical protein GXO79_01455 [Chlorobi bacterium]|nr:hypothetical protein [Chlorobiota bacterium]
MKTHLLKQVLITLIISQLFLTGFSQSNETKKETLTVLNIDAQGLTLNAQQLGNLVRIEIDKLGLFEVMDRYDVAYLVDKNNLDISNCFGKICLVETGEVLKSDKMLSGSIEKYGEIIIMTLRLVDVKTATTEKTKVIEFLNLPDELQTMISVTLKKMFDLPVDDDLLAKLTNKFELESTINNPDKNRLNLSGPRMGFTIYTAETAKILSQSEKIGGYDAFPMMFQFGYQFEQQYLNAGNFQALFEFLPMITGLDQGMINPSFTIMNGLRNNKNGWEFGFGPTFYFFKQAYGFYDSNNNWVRDTEWDGAHPANPDFEKRLDSRGDTRFGSGFVFAIGKSFKSGSLNIPVNMYIIPNKKGIRFGASFGFNAKK